MGLHQSSDGAGRVDDGVAWVKWVVGTFNWWVTTIGPIRAGVPGTVDGEVVAGEDVYRGDGWVHLGACLALSVHCGGGDREVSFQSANNTEQCLNSKAYVLHVAGDW